MARAPGKVIALVGAESTGKTALLAALAETLRGMSGVFDEAEASAFPGVFAAAEDCLLLAVVARKPLV